jgi:hypothetical protein
MISLSNIIYFLKVVYLPYLQAYKNMTPIRVDSEENRAIKNHQIETQLFSFIKSYCKFVDGTVIHQLIKIKVRKNIFVGQLD